MRRRQGKDSSSTADQRLCTKENCLTCCKKFTAFMFSRVGLFVVMIGYVGFGGWLFQALEAQNEQNMRRSMIEKLNSTLYKLWDEILRVNSYPYQDKRGNFTLYATQELEKFEETVIQQVQQGFDGRIRPDADPDWNYFGAILYAVTLISTIGYGHITTKTVQGKIATILYSAFGVPLMMLFVANIGSTMAKMFAFVFSRITMIFCCRWKKDKRRRSVKPRQINNQTTIVFDEKKSNLKRTKDERELSENTSPLPDLPAKPKFRLDSNSSHGSSLNNTDSKQLPADIRLNMLTGAPSHPSRSRSVTSSTSTVVERSKDALVRINELIRQNSVQDVDMKSNDDVFLSSPPANHSNQSQTLDDISSIQFYINETNKLTSNLENSIHEPTIETKGKSAHVTNLDDADIQQIMTPDNNGDKTKVTIKTENETKKSSKKQLRRSKSESSHNHKSCVKVDDNEPVKSSRRRFFTRKLKKQATLQNETNQTTPLEQEATEIVDRTNRRLQRKSQSFHETPRPLPPPPAYEESTAHEVTSLPSVTWKPDSELHSTKTTFDFPVHSELEDDEEFYEDEPMSVPLLVTVFVIPLYLTLGAILFNIWEKWGLLNSFYFCFITLTTIGFGDYVPGTALTVTAPKEKLISAALYIVLGLVLSAMCFNLMKEQISQKVKRIAGKWGISEF